MKAQSSEDTVLGVPESVSVTKQTRANDLSSEAKAKSKPVPPKPAPTETIHIWSALIAVGIMLAVLLFGLVKNANALESEYVEALAPLRPEIAIKGTSLVKAALTKPDLLSVYGASEMFAEPGDFEATSFFRYYPTGFMPFDSVFSGATSLVYSQSVAGLGEALRGKKIVISFTPPQFFIQQSPHWYTALYSPLHANELIFSSDITYDVKQLAAAQMLRYPDTVASDPLLSFALTQLTDNTRISAALYDLAYPLGRLQTGILELQDQYATESYILSVLPHLKTKTPHIPATIDWNADVTKAYNELLPTSNNNPYGFNNRIWTRLSKTFTPETPPAGDPEFIAMMNSSDEWGDLEVLLRILQELGAQPLLLGRATNDAYYNALGVSDAALQMYYDKIDQIAQQYGVQIVDFQDLQHQTHLDFDPAPHTSPEGWVYVDQALDAFYHEAQVPPQAAAVSK